MAAAATAADDAPPPAHTYYKILYQHPKSKVLLINGNDLREEEDDGKRVFLIPRDELTFDEKIPIFIQRTTDIARIYNSIPAQFLAQHREFNVFFLKVFDILNDASGELAEELYKAWVYSGRPGQEKSTTGNQYFPFTKEEHTRCRSHADYYSCKYNSRLVLVQRKVLFGALRGIIHVLNSKDDRKKIRSRWFEFKKMPVTTVMAECDHEDDEKDDNPILLSTPATCFLFTGNILKVLADIEDKCGFSKTRRVVNLISELAFAFVYGYSNGVFVPHENVSLANDEKKNAVLVRDNPIFPDKQAYFINASYFQGRTSTVFQSCSVFANEVNNDSILRSGGDEYPVYVVMLQEELDTICRYCDYVFGVRLVNPSPIPTLHHLNENYLPMDVNLCCGLYDEVYASRCGCNNNDALRAAFIAVGNNALNTIEKGFTRSGSQYSKRKCEEDIIGIFKRQRCSGGKNLLHRLYSHLIHQFNFHKVKVFNERCYRSVIANNKLIARCVWSMRTDAERLVRDVVDTDNEESQIASRLIRADVAKFAKTATSKGIDKSLFDRILDNLKLISANSGGDDDFCSLTLHTPLELLETVGLHRSIEIKSDEDFKAKLVELFWMLNKEIDEVAEYRPHNNDVGIVCIYEYFSRIITATWHWIPQNFPSLGLKGMTEIRNCLDLKSLDVVNFIEGRLDGVSVKISLDALHTLLNLQYLSVAKADVFKQMKEDCSPENRNSLLFCEMACLNKLSYSEFHQEDI